MPSPSLPAENHDLITLVVSNRRRFIRKWLLLTAVFLIPAVAFFRPAAGLYGVPVAILLLLGFVIFPFFACGGWDVITDQAFTGTVESMKFSVSSHFRDGELDAQKDNSSPCGTHVTVPQWR